MAARGGARRIRLALGLAVVAVTALALGPVSSSSAASGLVVGAEHGFSGVPAATGQADPAVAWNGTVFLVVWTQPVGTEGRSQVRVSRVTATGTVLDPAGVPIGAPDEFAARPAVAAGAGGFLVVYENANPDTYSDLRAAMVSGSSTGSLTIEREWGLSFADNDQDDPAVAWNGQLFLVTFADLYNESDGLSVAGVRVLRNG